MKKNKRVLLVIGLLLTNFHLQTIFAQTEVMAWSNITGVRVDGELIDFESSLRVGDFNTYAEPSKKEWQRPLYHREGNTQEVRTNIRKVRFTQKVTDIAKSHTHITIEAQSDTTMSQAAYFCITLTPENYSDAKIRVRNKKITITSANRQIKLDSDKPLKTIVKEEEGNRVIYMVLMPTLQKGTSKKVEIDLYATGTIDHSDANIALNIKEPGSLFVGFGGNFRLQNPKNDPKVIDYCLKNLRVAYGRVEFPWRTWHPEENMDPVEHAQQNGLPVHVEKSMLMAKRLKETGMPVILSGWFPPFWAIDGKPEDYKQGSGVVAYRLNPQKKEKIYKSIADYLVYLKKNYGVEIAMFSFNESDLGIDVLHTPQQHAEFIKEFGEYLAKLNLPTKMLLGDNSDATTFDFILPAMKDNSTHKYIGAISFHSWRGCDDATLAKWREAAKQLNVPLIIGEGSTDAAAHRYAEIFNESTFALYEINLYTRICAICQPLSILQWQLTSDYSLLWGDGIYRSQGPLRPTQRFWNMKQLASTPEEALSIPVTSSKKNINAAAFGNVVRGEYAIHLVNNGADCNATITGLPQDIQTATVFITNTKDSMTPSTVTVKDGKVQVHLPAISFITIITEKPIYNY